MNFTTLNSAMLSAHPVLLAGLAALVAAVCASYVTSVRAARRLRAIELELSRMRSEQLQSGAVQAEREQGGQQRLQLLEARTGELLQQRLQLEAANRRLRRLVTIDALTGIANRRHFDASLEREVRRARRDGQPLSLIFLDLDEFKGFNDTYGHPRGDEVLKRVAQTLNETFRRGGDFVARYGGEEFAVVLPDVDARRAALYAERLRRRIWRLGIPYGKAASERVTISGGVATLPPGLVASPAQLLRAADQALYRAKCLGRNQIASAAVETEERVDTALAS